MISLNRPEEKNLLNLATVGDLKKAISNYENDCSSTIAILYGEGGSFCAGLESEELAVEQIYNVPNNKHISFHSFFLNLTTMIFIQGFFTNTLP